MSFYVGEFTRAFRESEIHTLSHVQDTEHLQDGDVVSFFGHVVQWDSQHCVPEAVCRQWRTVGDPLCDAALETVFPTATSSVGQDLLASLEQYVADNPGHNPARVFLDEVSQAPPAGIQASEEEVELGQAFFLDYAIQIMQALLHYSLAAGFASARIVRTLQAVSYLVPPLSKGAPESSGTAFGQTESTAADSRTFTRLMETFQFVLDVMGCAIESPPSSEKWGKAAYLMPGGEGWGSAVRVRMLHGVARRRARERLRKLADDDAEERDVPISQEDMTATLASFSTVPIWALHRLHLTPPPDQVAAYLALWRHVGFYLGVSPSILTRYLPHPAAADKLLVSLVLDLFSPPDPADSGPPLALSTLPTLPILRAVSTHAPTRRTLAYNVALTRHLAGPALADHLGLPRTAPWLRVQLRLALFVQALPAWFAAYYPRRAWREERRAVLREGIARSLRWSLGLRRVSFRPRTEVRADAANGHGESSTDDIGGELADGVKEAESVDPNPAAGKRLMRAWRAVLVEMVGVSVCVAITSCFALWWCLSLTLNYFLAYMEDLA